jgi:hypothetical protein
MSGTYTGGTWRAVKSQNSACIYPWSVKDGVYQIFGSTAFNPSDLNFDLNSLNQSDWTLIGEGTATKTFEVTTAYTWLLIT